MDVKTCRVTAGVVPLTALERVYELLAPAAFRAAQGWERLAGATAEELRSRRGLVRRMDGAVVWFHGASAGEMSAALALDEILRERGFTFNPIYTATNRAGVEYVVRREPHTAIATLAPWDTRESLSRALEQWRPRLIFLVETELWPRLIYEASIRHIPIFCVSARIYSRDIPRYRAIKPFFAPTLHRLTRIIAQDEIERGRFRQIGAPECSCLSAGNLKYLKLPSVAGSEEIATEIGIHGKEPIVVVGSVHKEEAGEILSALHRLRIPELRIVIAPRHLSSVEFVLEEAGKLGWAARRRSDTASGRWQVLVLDSIGELKRFYSIATCAIVGGGFAKYGGHNPFEPVMAGAPVAFGPHFENFEAESRALAAAVPEARVQSMRHLEKLLASWLSDGSRRLKVLALQRAAIPDGDAIADRYVEALAPWLSAIRA